MLLSVNMHVMFKSTSLIGISLFLILQFRSNMIPYEVIKKGKSDMTMIKCGCCSKIFKTVQQHEQHRCRKENNFNNECLSCKKPYTDHLVPQNDNNIHKGNIKLFNTFS